MAGVTEHKGKHHGGVCCLQRRSSHSRREQGRISRGGSWALAGSSSGSMGRLWLPRVWTRVVLPVQILPWFIVAGVLVTRPRLSPLSEILSLISSLQFVHHFCYRRVPLHVHVKWTLSNATNLFKAYPRYTSLARFESLSTAMDIFLFQQHWIHQGGFPRKDGYFNEFWKPSTSFSIKQFDFVFAIYDIVCHHSKLMLDWFVWMTRVGMTSNDFTRKCIEHDDMKNGACGAIER